MQRTKYGSTAPALCRPWFCKKSRAIPPAGRHFHVTIVSYKRVLICATAQKCRPPASPYSSSSAHTRPPTTNATSSSSSASVSTAPPCACVCSTSRPPAASRSLPTLPNASARSSGPGSDLPLSLRGYWDGSAIGRDASSPRTSSCASNARPCSPPTGPVATLGPLGACLFVSLQLRPFSPTRILSTRVPRYLRDPVRGCLAARARAASFCRSFTARAASRPSLGGTPSASDPCTSRTPGRRGKVSRNYSAPTSRPARSRRPVRGRACSFSTSKLSRTSPNRGSPVSTSGTSSRGAASAWRWTRMTRKTKEY